MLDALDRIRLSRELTTLLVTHSQQEIQALCEGVIHLGEGRIIEKTEVKGKGFGVRGQE